MAEFEKTYNTPFLQTKRCIELEGNKNGRFVLVEFKKNAAGFYFQLKYLKHNEIISSLFRSNISSVDLTNDKWCYTHCFLKDSETDLFLDYYKERLGLKLETENNNP